VRNKTIERRERERDIVWRDKMTLYPAKIA